MKKITDILGKNIIIGDGAMGTLLQNEISGSFIPEELNLSRPELIRKIHLEYAKSGADILTTNTFGGTSLKLEDVSLSDRFEEINSAAVKTAREVADSMGIFVAGDIGPCGIMVDPMGELSFDQARNIYGDQAKVLELSGADFILLETITDIQEFRAAVVGITETVKIPVFASFSFTNDELSMSGTPADVFAVTSGFTSLSAVGANCGTTLDNMGKIIEKIVKYSSMPVLCQPNAGLPEVENGKTVFNIGAVEFADFMEKIYETGVSVIGSCCGSTPDFTKELADRFGGRKVVERSFDKQLFLTSGTRLKRVSNRKIFLVGERINPTGRKKLRREIMEGKLTTLRADAVAQGEKGSDALDVNINLHKLKSDVVSNVIKSVQNMVDIPLFIDSTDEKVVEEFCKLNRGKGVINSISGEEESLAMILPLVKKYNMAFIAALLDDKGIPDTSSERLRIAEKIFNSAKKEGINTENIIFDPLVISAGSDHDAAKTTIDTIKLLKDRFPKNMTVAGISNVSFGLPGREIINPVFLGMAAGAGLDMVIANPLSEPITDMIRTINLLKESSAERVTDFAEKLSNETGIVKEKDKSLEKSDIQDLKEDVINGDTQSAVRSVAEILTTESAVEIIKKYIIPAMNEVGKRYQEGTYFLPHLIASADTVKAILPEIKKNLPKKSAETNIKILFATVKGDIHDIGKNILTSILESFNYEIIDLGKNVPPGKIVEEAVKNGVHIVALSTLMTTTIPSLINSVEMIKSDERLKDVKIFIGGAVVTKKMADEIGVYFTRDGMEMVKMIKELLKKV